MASTIKKNRVGPTTTKYSVLSIVAVNENLLCGIVISQRNTVNDAQGCRVRNSFLVTVPASLAGSAKIGDIYSKRIGNGKNET